MSRISLGVCLMFLVASSAIYEVQGTFLLRHYLRKLPRRSNDCRPFACQGMLKLVDVLEVKCPGKPEYKNFFGKLKTCMSFISSASASGNFDAQMKGQAAGLNTAISALGGKGGSAVVETLMSMGKTLVQTQQGGSASMSFAQRKELVMSMASWAKTICQFVASTAAQSGASIDISSVGLDGIDANADAAASASSDSAATGSAAAGGSVNTGSQGSASTGYQGSASTGSQGSASTGSQGSASTGYQGAASAGSQGAASAGYQGSASTGSQGAVSAGYQGAASGGYQGSASAGSQGSFKGGSQGSFNSGSQGSVNTGGGCTTSACSSGGGGGSIRGGGSFKAGGSFKGSMNYQSGGSAQHTAGATSN